MTTWLLPILAVAAVNWWAVYRPHRRAEVAAKPLTMAALTLWLAAAVGLHAPAGWFILALALSLLGDIFLLLSDRWFIWGLAAFLLAHLAYLVGFNTPIPAPNLFTFFLAFSLAILAARVYRLLSVGLPAKLRKPVLAYTAVITLMTLSAINTLFRTDWKAGAALLAAFGAVLFFVSDIILAYNRFVRPVRHGRFWNMMAYHLGQIALALSVWMQYAG